MKFLDDLQYHIYKNIKEHRTFKWLNDILCFLSWLGTPTIFKHFLYDKCALCGQYTSMWHNGGVMYRTDTHTKKMKKTVYCERCYHKNNEIKEKSYAQKYSDLFTELREMLYPETKEEFERVKSKYEYAIKYYDDRVVQRNTQSHVKKIDVDYEIQCDDSTIEKK